MDAPLITGYRYITRVPGTAGGRPIIRGTRTTVKNIVGFYKLGMSPDELLRELPHLTPAQLFEALSYYYDHEEEIEGELAADRGAYLRLKAGQAP